MAERLIKIISQDDRPVLFSGDLKQLPDVDRDMSSYTEFDMGTGYSQVGVPALGEAVELPGIFKGMSVRKVETAADPEQTDDRNHIYEVHQGGTVLAKLCFAKVYADQEEYDFDHDLAGISYFEAGGLGFLSDEQELFLRFGGRLGHHDHNDMGYYTPSDHRHQAGTTPSDHVTAFRVGDNVFYMMNDLSNRTVDGGYTRPHPSEKGKKIDNIRNFHICKVGDKGSFGSIEDTLPATHEPGGFKNLVPVDVGDAAYIMQMAGDHLNVYQIGESGGKGGIIQVTQLPIAAKEIKVLKCG
ncbi:MAG: hypothetical protein ABIH34_06735 [Nanoarchaeota archaeon]